MSVGMIWAQSADRYIGADGALPWHLPEDLAFFRRVTLDHPVIMGRRTWESLPDRFRPLPGRRNIVLSRTRGLRLEGATVATDAAHALELAGTGDAWVIGGAQVYETFLPHADRLEVTQVDLVVDGDTRAPTLGAEWRVVAREPERGWCTSATGLPYRFLSFARVASD